MAVRVSRLVIPGVASLASMTLQKPGQQPVSPFFFETGNKTENYTLKSMCIIAKLMYSDFYNKLICINVNQFLFHK